MNPFYSTVALIISLMICACSAQKQIHSVSENCDSTSIQYNAKSLSTSDLMRHLETERNLTLSGVHLTVLPDTSGRSAQVAILDIDRVDLVANSKETDNSKTTVNDSSSMSMSRDSSSRLSDDISTESTVFKPPDIMLVAGTLLGAAILLYLLKKLICFRLHI